MRGGRILETSSKQMFPPKTCLIQTCLLSWPLDVRHPRPVAAAVYSYRRSGRHAIETYEYLGPGPGSGYLADHPGRKNLQGIRQIASVDQDKVNASTDGTSTTEVIHNMDTLNALPSACFANSEYTATMTDPVLDLELAHVTKIFELFSTAGSAGALWQGPRLLYEPRIPPRINGPAMVCIYWGGTVAASAFCSAQWIEYPSSFS